MGTGMKAVMKIKLKNAAKAALNVNTKSILADELVDKHLSIFADEFIGRKRFSVLRQNLLLLKFAEFSLEISFEF